MNIIAHKSKDGREQSLQEHGQNVAKMAASFAAPFGGEKFAERIGVSHDAGKNTVGFQQYIQAPDKNAKSPHAIIAAALNCQANDVLSAVITEGHHSGLHNVLDTITNVRAAFAERSQDIATAREHFSTDAINQIEIIPEFARKNKVFGQYAFTKMEFSCLTDADYQDTERFMRGYSPRSYNYDSFSGIYDMFRKHIQPWIDKDNKMVGENNQQLTKNEEINHMRTQMMLQCLNAGSNSRKGDIRTLSIPTGGSKTLSSFAYAIAAAKKDTSMVNTSYSSYNTLGKIEGAFQLSFPMSYDPIRIASISNTRCCVSSDDERKGNEKVPKNKDRTMGRFSVVEYGLYHMYIQTSTKAILRNGVTEDDLKLLIQTILHMFDDDMSSVRPSMTVRKVVVVRQNRNSGRVRPTDIEDAMVAKLKPGVNSPTSFNDYNLEFKRDMLPDSVEVKEYTMDNPDGIIL